MLAACRAGPHGAGQGMGEPEPWAFTSAEAKGQQECAHKGRALRIPAPVLWLRSPGLGAMC